MLYSIESGRYMDFTPYENEFKVWRSRLSAEQYDRICDELNSRIAGDEIHTSSWIPGSDWSGTVFEPIYSVACHCDPDSSARFFGLIMWEVVKHHDQTWSYGRYEKNGIPINGLTYFRIQNPPVR